MSSSDRLRPVRASAPRRGSGATSSEGEGDCECDCGGACVGSGDPGELAQGEASSEAQGDDAVLSAMALRPRLCAGQGTGSREGEGRVSLYAINAACAVVSGGQRQARRCC